MGADKRYVTEYLIILLVMFYFVVNAAGKPFFLSPGSVAVSAVGDMVRRGEEMIQTATRGETETRTEIMMTAAGVENGIALMNAERVLKSVDACVCLQNVSPLEYVIQM